MYILMDVKDRSVQNLILRNVYTSNPDLAIPLLRQMLQALDYLASQDIMHGDVKLENIFDSRGRKCYILAC